MVQPGAAGTVLNGCRVGGGDLLLLSDGDVQITQPAVVQSVNPAMHRQLLSALPDVTHDGSLAYIEYYLSTDSWAIAAGRVSEKTQGLRCESGPPKPGCSQRGVSGRS